MLIEHIIKHQFRGPWPPGRTCTPITGYFYDKTKISKENLPVDYYLLRKCCKEQCTLLPPTWTKSLTIKIYCNSKMQDVKRVLDLNCKEKKD